MTHSRTRRSQPLHSGGGLLPAISTLGLSLALVVGTAAAASAGGAQGKAAAARAMIITNWKTFFNSKTPPAKKVKLVQDGPEFAKVIEAQSKMPLAQGVASRVSKVTLDKSMTRAKVVYTVTIQGAAALSNQAGTAILQAGTWKVGAQSFCALLALEGSAKQVPVCRAK